MRSVIIAVSGTLVALSLARAGRRFAVGDRLRVAGRSRALPRAIEQPINAALEAAALDWSAIQAVQIWLLATPVAGMLGAAFAGTAGLVCAGAVGVGGPFALRLAGDRGRRRVAAAVPETVEVIASELRAGGTIATAITGVASGDGALARDLARVEARVRLGASHIEALQLWVHERDAPGVEAAGGALALCTVVGGRAADALDGLASSLRERLGVLAEARALSSQARLSALVIGLAPLAYLAFSTAIDGRTAQLLFGSAVGRVCLVVGLALEGIGAWWMRLIVTSGDEA
jgi:tight adherence protein B